MWCTIVKFRVDLRSFECAFPNVSYSLDNDTSLKQRCYPENDEENWKSFKNLFFTFGSQSLKLITAEFFSTSKMSKRTSHCKRTLSIGISLSIAKLYVASSRLISNRSLTRNSRTDERACSFDWIARWYCSRDEFNFFSNSSTSFLNERFRKENLFFDFSLFFYFISSIRSFISSFCATISSPPNSFCNGCVVKPKSQPESFRDENQNKIEQFRFTLICTTN